MTDRNGVRVGQRVRDLDGRRLGRVKELHDWGFEVVRFPLLFRREAVVRYGEVRGIRDGELVVARSSRDLLDLAEGRLPPSWRIPAPPGFPGAATPDEAQLVLRDLAAGRITGAGDLSNNCHPDPAVVVSDSVARSHDQSGSPRATGGRDGHGRDGGRVEDHG